MIFRRLLILFALVLSAGKIFAASESRAFEAATAAFQAQLWNRAETEFAQFREKFPDSTNAPQAILLQAQAAFKQGKLTNSISLLHDNMAGAAAFADQYTYWIGESEFAESNFVAAADTFTSLAQNFPDSPLRVRGIVEAASAQAQLKKWPQVEALLGETNGVFQNAARADSGDEIIARGQLLLAQAELEQNNFSGAAEVLDSVHSKLLAPQLDWQRADLLCRAKIGTGDLRGALAVTTNLLQIAGVQRNDNLTAESKAMQAGILEKLNLPDEAIAAYRENLQTNAPVARQRQAILKIGEIYEAQNQFSNAAQSLVDFTQQFSNAPAADTVSLALGELHLKIYEAEHSTNDLENARSDFDQFIGAFTNSPLLGKAFLDRGWCDWFEGNISQSLSDFESAAQKLPPSKDLAIAKFKIGDALFLQNDFSGARENYNAVANDFTNLPDVARSLGAAALYQSLRASEELKDGVGASNALARLLRQFPVAELTRNAELLYAEGLGDLGKPQDARETFQVFEQQWPNSDLQPQVEFAIARTYELERNWPAAIASYEKWLAEFPANGLRPRAAYSLAWANSEAANETNALALFKNFVAQFPTNHFAPQAQWWIADQSYNTGQFVSAETNYALVYQNWPASDLAYPARVMAGRAALGRGGYTDAMRYFRDTINDTNCPPDFKAQARFALGTTLMSSESADATNLLANMAAATNVFARLIQNFPTNPLAWLAQIKIGDCDLQLNSFDAATNAYAAVFTATNADVSLRSEAQIGFGIALEKQAASASPGDQKALQQSALNNYLDVFYENNLRAGESADPFWTKKAGLQALSLIETLGVADPNKFIDQMEALLPQLKESLEKKRAELSQTKS